MKIKIGDDVYGQQQIDRIVPALCARARGTNPRVLIEFAHEADDFHRESTGWICRILIFKNLSEKSVRSSYARPTAGRALCSLIHAHADFFRGMEAELLK